MPNSDKIETLISKEAIAQFDQLNQKVEASITNFEQLIAKGVALNKELGGAKGFKDLAAGAKALEELEIKLAKAQADLLASQEKLKKSQEDEAKTLTDLEKQRAKLNASYTEEAKEIAQLKVQQQEQNKVLKDQAKEALGLAGAYDKLTKEYNDAAKSAKDLAAQFGAQSKQAKEASARALELDARLKAADANVGRYNKNVGNYSGALNTLKDALQDVSKRIDDNTRSGQQNVGVIESLQKEQGLLQSLIDAQSKGFANATGEIRNNQQAILLLSQVYGEDSAVVQELTAKTAKLADTVGDMKATIKAQASDTHVFDGLIGAAQGLVGIYSVAQGAAALFGNENEELQKTFVKLQAVMSVLQGLQSIQNALQKESAARQLINIGLQKLGNIQTSVQTALESKNIVVRYAAIVAQKALNLAMSAAGGPILAVIGIITLLVVSLKAFASQAEGTRKSLDQLTAEFDRDLDSLQNYSDSVKRNGDEIVADMEANFATQSDIRKQQVQNLQDQLKASLELEQDYAYQVSLQRSRLIKVLKKNADDRTDQEKEDLEKQDALIKKYEAQQKKRVDLASQIRVQLLQNSRATTEETIKAQQENIEAEKSGLQTRLQFQQSIAANERKTQDERINALRESARIQQQLINSDADSKRLTPGLTPSQIKAIEATRTAALTQARRDSNKAIEDLNRSYAERERKARFDITKTEIEDQIKADDLIVANESNSFDKRLTALNDSLQKRRSILTAQHDLDIKNDTLTADERIAIEKKYTSDVNALTIEYGLQQQELYKQNQEQINAIIEKNQQGRLDQISTQQANQLSELDKQFRDGNITVEQYSRERAAIELKYSVITLKQEVDNATAKVLATKEGTAERYAAEKDLADKTLALNDAVTQKQIESQQKLADAKKELTSQAFETVSALQNAQFDKETAAIQAQIDGIDVQKQKDIDAANASIGTAEEKATAIAKIEAKAQLQRETLERRQRQIELERARFDKEANIAKIISDTASAVVAALGQRPFTPANIATAAIVGSIGALQLARAIATPLPKFEHGTVDAPGGLALVSEKRRELLITPDGKMMQTPSVPTVMNIPKHSIILPDARAAMESGLAVNQHGRLVQNRDNDNSKIEQKLDIIARAIKNKPVLNMSADQGGLTAMWKYGSNMIKYIEDQTQF